MIVRILGEGQFDITDACFDSLNVLDDAVEKASSNGSRMYRASSFTRFPTTRKAANIISDHSRTRPI